MLRFQVMLKFKATVAIHYLALTNYTLHSKVNKCKKQLHKTKGEVGMVVPKSTQTRMIEIITYMVHPYACFLVMVHRIPVHVFIEHGRDTLHSLSTGYIWPSLAIRWSEWRKGATYYYHYVFHTALISKCRDVPCMWLSYHPCLSTFWFCHHVTSTLTQVWPILFKSWVPVTKCESNWSTHGMLTNNMATSVLLCTIKNCESGEYWLFIWLWVCQNTGICYYY